MASQVSDILNKLTFCPVPDDWVRLEEHCQIETLVLKMWTPWIAFANATICPCLTNTLGCIHYILKRQIKWLKCWLRCLGSFMATDSGPCYSAYCGYIQTGRRSTWVCQYTQLSLRSMIPYLSQEGFKRKLPAKQCGHCVAILSLMCSLGDRTTPQQAFSCFDGRQRWLVMRRPPFGDNLSFPPRLWEVRFG